MEQHNKSLLEMMREGNCLYGDSYHFWLETKYGLPTGYHVAEEDVRQLLTKDKIRRIGGASKDLYRVV
jgi:hypothetical protein